MSPARAELAALVAAARRALETGRLDTARMALEDARRVDRDHPDVVALAERLELRANGAAGAGAAPAWGDTVNWEAGPILPPVGDAQGPVDPGPVGGAALEDDGEDAVDWFGSGSAAEGAGFGGAPSASGDDAPALTLLLAEADPPAAGDAPGPVRRAQGKGGGEAATLMDEARALFARGDFTGSLQRVERTLELTPGHPEAVDYLGRNEATLIQMYESKIGPLDRVPRLAVDPDEVAWLTLDHRAGFVLAQVDGLVTWEDLFALSGMSRLDTSRILAELVEEGVVRAD